MGLQCSGGQVYSECAQTCGLCRDQQLDGEYCNQGCLAGCSCPDGQLLDDHGQCVSPSDCTCFDAYDPLNPIKRRGDMSTRGCVDW